MNRAFLMRAALCLGLGIAPAASGAVYYVDSLTGSDDQAGNSPFTPWNSLAKVAATQFSPGDYILLRRGSKWHQQLVLTSSGSLDLPITLGAYGPGNAPQVDGSILGPNQDLLSVSGKSDIVVSGIEFTNGPASGVNLMNCLRVTLRNLSVSANRYFGILVYNSGSVTIENSEVSNNGLDTSASYDGIRIDGSGMDLYGFVIRGCNIHHNIGGDGWRSDNGIFLGHTGGSLPALHAVQILGNELAYNGYPLQNQAGRGLTGTFSGDVTVTGNYVHDTASAGIYLGDEGVPVDITIARNTFYNNALRQFGGYTTSTARAYLNAVFVDNALITAMGAEVGGAGTWQITNNVFFYRTTSSDSYRGFIRVNDSTQDKNLYSDCNLFYSPSPDRWMMSNGITLSFPQWMGYGFDLNSKNPF